MTPHVMGMMVATMMTSPRLHVDVAAFDDGALPGVVIKLKASCDNSCKDGDFQCLLVNQSGRSFYAFIMNNKVLLNLNLNF